MLNLKIIFERTVNRGFADEKDKIVIDKRTGEKRTEIGTKGEHVQVWTCNLTDKAGWPVISLSREYFQRKMSAEGYKPIEISGEGPVPDAWTPEMASRVFEVLNTIRPLVETNKRLLEAERRLAEYEQDKPKPSGNRKSKAELNQESAQPLSAEG